MVDGINNKSIAEIAKLALAKKGTGASAAAKPAWMTQDGSVWNAPKPPAEEKPQSVSDLKSLNVDNLKTKRDCEKALKDIEEYSKFNLFMAATLKGKAEEITRKKNQLSSNESQENLQNIANGTSAKSSGSASSSTGTSQKEQEQLNAKDISASQGKAMASSVKKEKENVASQTKTTEKNTQTANKYSKDAAKDQKSLTKQQKSMEKQNKAATKTIQQNQTKIGSLTDTLNDEDAEVSALQAELASLTADNTGVGVNSAFSLSLAGTEEHDKAQQDDPNAQRIAELQGQITTKTATMKTTSAKVGKLQTSTNKQIKTMHKVSIKYMANVKNTEKSLESNQKASDKILDVANKVEEISTTVATAGTALKYAGQALVALGNSTTWCFGAGAALVAAGAIMQKVGVVAEIAGQYGQMAAGITKTACYAAQGNLAGALTSAGSAIMSGTSAIKGTKELGSTFQKINEKATQATQKLAAGVAARESVKDMTKEELGGLSKKEARKLAKEGAMQSLEGQSAKEIKNSFKKGVGNLAENAKAGADKAVSSAIDVTSGMSKDAIKQGIKNGTIVVGDNATTIVKEAAKEVKKESKKLLTFDNAMKVGNTFKAAGDKMMGMAGPKQAGQAGKSKGGYAPHYLTNPSKGYAMFNDTQARLARRGQNRMYA